MAEEEEEISPNDYGQCDTCNKFFVPRQQWGKWRCFRHPGQKVGSAHWEGLPEWSCCGLVDEFVNQFPGRLFGTDLWGCTPCDHHCTSMEGPQVEVMVLAAHTPEARDTLRHIVRRGFSSRDTEGLDAGMVRTIFSRVVPAAYSDPRFWATLETALFEKIRTRVQASRATAFPIENYYSGRPRQLMAEDRSDAELIAAAKAAERTVAEAIAADLEKQKIAVPLVLVSTGAEGPDEKFKNRIARVLKK
jgi:hypothetical protein